MTTIEMMGKLYCPTCKKIQPTADEGMNECASCGKMFIIEIVVRKKLEHTPEQLEKIMGFYGTKESLVKLGIRKRNEHGKRSNEEIRIP